MKTLKSIFAFYINSSIHVSLAVVAMFGVSVLEYRLKVPRELWYFLFFASITGYNFIKYADLAELHYRNLSPPLQAIQIFSALCIPLLAWTVLKLSVDILFMSLGLALITFSYSKLRKFSGLKIFVVAFAWASVTVLIPVAASQTKITNDLLLTFIQRILIVVVLILPFEIRDMNFDSIQLKTLPQQFGIRRTKI